jgi:DNA/RNA-binding domain of Phe-tRNA-synthetase-like protein
MRVGFVAPEVHDEFPGLRVAWIEVEASDGPTPADLRERLRAMADRFRGPQAIALRGQDVPHAHRVFFRHVGLDPDVRRTPVEAAAVRRMQHGGFRAEGLVADACTVAVVETGVGVWALDAERVRGDIGIRTEGGRLVLSDEVGPLCDLFAEPEPEFAVTRGTRRIALVSVAVPGVPGIFVEEALWIASDILSP